MTTMTGRTTRSLLALILLVYLLLAVGYGFLNPLFESPDEHWHYFTTQYIADNWELPAVTEDYDEWMSQEAAQPPLYYMLGALLIAPIEAENGRSQTTHNPFATIGDASYRTNINRFIHTEAEAWPWQDFALAAHILRLFSTLLGLGTLLCIYGSSRLIWPNRPEIGLLATALVAFLPQFAFLHSAITNDALIIFLASFALWQILWIWIDGEGNGRFLLLGITLGLASLTKTAGILLLVYTVGIVCLLWLKDFNTKGQRDKGTKENLYSLIINLLWILLPALLIGGWLWLRNWQLYGDITATEPFIRIAGGDRGYTLWQVLSEYDGLWASLFAIFGWFNLRPPDWVFWVWNGIVVVAIMGFFKGIRDWRLEIERPHINLQSPISNLNQPWFIVILLTIWVIGVYAGLVTFMMKTEAAQGRLLFPAILPLGLALAYGLSRFRWRWLYITVTSLALVTAVYSLFFVIAPAYALPPTIAQLPATAVSLNHPLSDTLTLVGAEIHTETAVPDDYLTLTLTWQTNHTPAEPSEFVVEMIGRDSERIANLHSLHGRGLYPDTLWPEGEIVADTFSILIDKTAVSPVLAPVFIGLAGDGTRIRIGDVKVAPETWPQAEEAVLAQIGEGIIVTQAELDTQVAKPGGLVTLNTQWQVQTAPGTDLTTFVHLAQPGQPPLATADSQPLNGQYPTHAWEVGEVINDQYSLLIPDDVANGRYPIWLGMYDAETITRLPLIINGERQTNDAVQIGIIEITQ